MNRTRTGRGAPPWAWMQTGPLTVDVEACMPNRDRERLAAEAAERIPANVHTEAVSAERVNAATESAHELTPQVPAERFATVKLVYTGSSPDEATPEGSPAAESASKQPRSKTRPAKPKRNLLGTRKSQRPSVPRKQNQPKTQAQIDVMRHRRVCTICHHPEREAIEEAFLQWRNVRIIANEFKASGGATSIYRHARALDLFKKRNLALRTCLEFVIEQSERIMPTAEGLVKAIRAYTRINDAGEWIDTPTTHIVKVVAVAPDGPNFESPAARLLLDVRKDRSNILYPNSGQIESAVRTDEGRVQQPFLPGSAQNVENDVTH
jgi:hypothetical protein